MWLQRVWFFTCFGHDFCHLVINRVWVLQSSLKLSVFYRKSYLFIDKIVNKSPLTIIGQVINSLGKIHVAETQILVISRRKCSGSGQDTSEYPLLPSPHWEGDTCAQMGESFFTIITSCSLA